MDLDKALRAMQQSDAWQNSAQAAALFAGVEYTPRFLAEMTKRFLDDLEEDDTGTILVPKTLGGDLVAAAETYAPEDPEEEPELAARLTEVEMRLAEIRTELPLQKAPPNDDESDEPGVGIGGRK